jgi:hypothetical protein
MTFLRRKTKYHGPLSKLTADEIKHLEETVGKKQELLPQTLEMKRSKISNVESLSYGLTSQCQQLT